MEKKKRIGGKLAKGVLFFCASLSVILVILMTVMIFKEGLPIFKIAGMKDFLLGSDWYPTAAEPSYGIFPMIIGSLYVTFLALLIGLPIGLLTAIFISEIASPKISRLLQQAVEILSGIPSVVYGFFGLTVIVPFVRTVFGGTGLSVLSAAFILAVMILPTLISVSAVSMRAVASSLRAGSLALGSTKWQSIYKVVLPAAVKGIAAGVVLSIGRAIGETMAVILVAGNTPAIPGGILDPVRTMTVNIVLEMAYVRPGTEHYTALFGTALVLFLFIMLLNLVVNRILHKAVSVNGE